MSIPPWPGESQEIALGVTLRTSRALEEGTAVLLVGSALVAPDVLAAARAAPSEEQALGILARALGRHWMALVNVGESRG